ncbi:ESX secretion-associated protein EspG [Mycobacterium intracellulare]|uniref:ESX secretion-associated protein EspG n=1 Tax=Mycobacterium intracellulare TaxID=1767 RepID=UPI0011409B65|nr:ESX secretion-associated protein EspG [Mycobacterium intracellulare]
MSRPPSFLNRPAPKVRGPRQITAIDTTCEGVWLMQALCGIEQLPSALLLRPYVSASGRPTGHPGIAVLQEAGAIMNDETVHPTVGRWLEILSAPDIALTVDVKRPGVEFMRMVIARRDGRHAAISRGGPGDADNITIEEVGSVPSLRVLFERIMVLCDRGRGPVEAASLSPITVRTADLVDGFARIVAGDHTPAAALSALNLSAEQRRILTLAADQPLMEVAFALMVHDSRGDHVAIASAAVTDTVEGRIVTGPILGEDRTWWTQIVPGTSDAGGAALRALVATVGTTWERHSRYK